MRMRFRLVAGLAMVVACGGGGGHGGDWAADLDLADAASHEEVAGDPGEDTPRDVPVQVGRDVIVDTGGGPDIRRDAPRDAPADTRDVQRDVRDVVRDAPYVHRDAGGDVPSRDAQKG